jgi:hypothetical protein
MTGLNSFINICCLGVEGQGDRKLHASHEVQADCSLIPCLLLLAFEKMKVQGKLQVLSSHYI